MLESDPTFTSEKPRMPEEIEDLETCGRRQGPSLIWALIAAGGMIASSLILKFTEVGGIAEFAIAMMPIPLLAGMYWALFRAMQNSDEMQRKKKLEALGLTVIISSLIFFAAGQLERIEIYQPKDFSDAWLIITVTYMVSYGLVALRYRV